MSSRLRKVKNSVHHFVKKVEKKIGFTLIELMMVISIIALLSSVVSASVATNRKKANDAKTKQEVRQVQLALETYNDEHGGYPTCEGGSSVCCIGADDCEVSGVKPGTKISGLGISFPEGHFPTITNDDGISSSGIAYYTCTQTYTSNSNPDVAVCNPAQTSITYPVYYPPTNTGNTEDDDIDDDGKKNNADNCPTNYNPNQENSDGDTKGDVCDSCPTDATDTCNNPVDTDGDGVPDSTDNCPSVSNPKVDGVQPDSDGDGIGDACDITIPCPIDGQPSGRPECDDRDGDGVNNVGTGTLDNCPDTANANQADWNNNGVGDVCDDYDGDSWYDSSDNCSEIYNPQQEDSDHDGLGNACDSDNNGYCHGTPSDYYNCSNQAESSCNSNCVWSSGGSGCTIGAVNCNVDDRQTCEDRGGIVGVCYWSNDYCYTNINACSSYDYNSCPSVTGCEWYSNQGSCSYGGPECSSKADRGSCENLGCSWYSY